MPAIKSFLDIAKIKFEIKILTSNSISLLAAQ